MESEIHSVRRSVLPIYRPHRRSFARGGSALRLHLPPPRKERLTLGTCRIRSQKPTDITRANCRFVRISHSSWHTFSLPVRINLSLLRFVGRSKREQPRGAATSARRRAPLSALGQPLRRETRELSLANTYPRDASRVHTPNKMLMDLNVSIRFSTERLATT